MLLFPWQRYYSRGVDGAGNLSCKALLAFQRARVADPVPYPRLLRRGLLVCRRGKTQHKNPRETFPWGTTGVKLDFSLGKSSRGVAIPLCFPLGWGRLAGAWLPWGGGGRTVPVAAVASERSHSALFGEVASEREQEHDALETRLPSAPGETSPDSVGLFVLGRFAGFRVKKWLQKKYFHRNSGSRREKPSSYIPGGGFSLVIATSKAG